jgi:hypothetical protein
VSRARVNQSCDRVDQRISDEQNSGDNCHAGRQGVRHCREDNGPCDGNDATGKKTYKVFVSDGDVERTTAAIRIAERGR